MKSNAESTFIYLDHSEEEIHRTGNLVTYE
jgi:hypothetical protein